MKRLIFFPAALLLTLSCLTANAQMPGGGGFRGGRAGQNGFGGDQNSSFLVGEVVLSPEEEGGEEVPGVGVTVIAISLSGSKPDTSYTVVGERGSFFLGGVKPGKVNVTFSMIGYEEISNTVTIEPGMNRIVANLQPEKEMLEAATIKEVVEPINIKQDTIIFNAAAVKTNKGEMAIDILEQMPGVEVSDNSVKVLDETVSQVYVDGALLFGKAPMSALNNISAEEVLKIKSYQEYANKDPNHYITKTESKQRVLDIETKSKIRKVFSGSMTAGGGFDTDSTYHKFRYTTGADIVYNTQELSANLSVNINNINDASVRRRGSFFRTAGAGGGAADLRAIRVNTGATRTWWSKEARNFALGSLGANYSFNNNYTVNESLTQMIYFPNDKYDYRENNSSSYSDNSSTVHTIGINGMKSMKDGSVQASANVSFNKSNSNSRNSNFNRQDDLTPQGTSSSTVSNNTGRSMDFKLDADKGFNNKWRLGFHSSLGTSAGNGGSAKVDTTISTLTYRVLDIQSDNGSRNFSLSPSVTYNFSDLMRMSLSYNFSDSYNTVERLAYDVTDPAQSLVDTVNTQMLTNSQNSHNLSLNYVNHFERLNANLSINLAYKSVGLNKDERFPVDDPYSHRFNSFVPSVNFGNDSMIDHWSFSYSMGTSTPSLEMIRPRLDNTNLYSVSAGNPDLKQSHMHSFNANFSSVLGKETRAALKARKKGDYTQMIKDVSTVGFNASFRFNTDVIANRRTYFAEETYLPEYGYTMPAQSTLSTYENVSNSYSANIGANLDTQITPIMCMFRTSLNCNWDDSPAFVNDRLTRTDNFSPSINVSLRTNYSRKVRLMVMGSGSYIYSHNDEKDNTSYFVERVNFNGEVNSILKHFYVGANYNKSFTQGISYKKIDDNILNMNLGGRFGPKNNINVAVSVHDVFNRNTGFSTSMQSDYIRNSWTHQFGRYVLFTLTYNFNQMRGNRMMM